MNNSNRKILLTHSGKINASIKLVYLLAVLSLYYLVIQDLFHHYNYLQFLNPDVLTYPFLAHNLLYQHGSLATWHLGTANYLFPEVLFFIVFKLFIKSTYLELLSYLFLQITVFLLITILLFRTVVKNGLGLRMGLLYSLIFLLLYLGEKDFSMYSPNALFASIYYPSFHFAVSLMVLFLLWFLIRYIEQPKPYLKILLFVLIFLAGISDPLSYIYFVFPVIISLFMLALFKKLDWRTAINLGCWLLIAFVTSYVCYHLLPMRYQAISMHPSFNLDSMLIYFKTVFLYFKNHMILASLWLIFMIWAPISLWRSWVTHKDNLNSIDLMIFLQWMTVIISTPLLILALSQLSTTGIRITDVQKILHHITKVFDNSLYIPYRYLVNYFLLPVFFGLTFFVYKLTKNFEFLYQVKWYFICVLLIMIIPLFVKKDGLSVAEVMHYYPSLAQCYNRAALKLHLTNGISDDYITENVLNAYNNTNTQVALVSANSLSPVHWQNSEQSFRLKSYDFIVAQHPSFENSVKAKFGKPDTVFSCAPIKGLTRETYYFYVYKHGQLNKVFYS